MLAFVVFAMLNAVYGERVIASRVIGAVHATPQAPALARLQPGDTITAVNGASVAYVERHRAADQPDHGR